MSMAPSAMSDLGARHRDVTGAVVEGVMTGRPVIAVVNAPGLACKPVVDAAVIALEQYRSRIVRVDHGSVVRLGPPVSALDHMAEEAEADAKSQTGAQSTADPVALLNQALKMLARHPSGEKRRLLVIEAAHLYQSQTLDQIVHLTTSGPPELPIQVLLAGEPTYWHGLQAPNCEETRRRMGVPLLVLPQWEPKQDVQVAGPTSNTSEVDQRATKRGHKLGRSGALLALLGAVLLICGVLWADLEVRSRFVARILEAIMYFRAMAS